jgi:hypothetical protein
MGYLGERLIESSFRLIHRHLPKLSQVFDDMDDISRPGRSTANIYEGTVRLSQDALSW